jgi:hypothetical protein
VLGEEREEADDEEAEVEVAKLKLVKKVVAGDADVLAAAIFRILLLVRRKCDRNWCCC